METIINKKVKKEKGAIISLGSFDGLHLGHQALIKMMLNKSKEQNLMSVLFTFYNHPTNIIENRIKARLLLSNEQKIKILQQLGIDLLYLLNFDRNIMALSPEEFIKNILVNQFNVKLIVVGFNYRFGYKGSGDTNTLIELGKKYGFEVIVVQPVNKDGNIVSSTFIRELLRVGKINEANKLLGRPYTISGTVVHGKGRGRKMGFPTANLCLEGNFITPKPGVYMTNTIYENNRYLSITNIGNNPTFNDRETSIETHIIEFKSDIYASHIEVVFLDYLREEKVFNNAECLLKQIMYDIEWIKNT